MQGTKGPPRGLGQSIDLAVIILDSHCQLSQAVQELLKTDAKSFQTFSFAVIVHCLILIGSLSGISRVEERMNVTGHTGPSGCWQG